MYHAAPLDSTNERQHRQQLARILNSVQQGHTNTSGEVTLTPNASTTVLIDPRLHPSCFLRWDPQTVNANLELYAGTMYVLGTDRQNGQCTIHHSNSAVTDRTFRYTITG